jgi:hypothetical protein
LSHPPPLDDLYAAFADPPAEFGAFPFWFWNDDLDSAELRRQLYAFHAAGCGGVVIHPRVGLSPRVGYLTDTYFRYVREVVDACAGLGMKVILYDEGSYPSGSACGAVVAEDPAHAARALALARHDIAGPWTGHWRAALGRSLVDRPVGVVLARTRDGAVLPETARLLQPDERAVVRVETGAGEWAVLAAVETPSGGRIRGVLPEQDDGMATAPAAGDIMNPAAVAAFIRLTHDAYARALGDHLGTTVVAMFTDEPSPFGRGGRRGAWPYTPGFERYLAERLGWPLAQALAWLPALWVDYGPGTADFRRRYERAVAGRIAEVFYGAQAAWCAQHGIALTGHPSPSNDMASLSRFTWPGQDMVWRYVTPGNDTALTGPHSVAAKAATSAARARRAISAASAAPVTPGTPPVVPPLDVTAAPPATTVTSAAASPPERPRIATELFGAYGWRLSLDEAKWLIDWHLARGNTLFIPHAAFYSVRAGRAFESEPDIGLHNPWWPHFPDLLRYVRRLSWLLSESEHVCAVAILGPGYDLPWHAAKTLYQHQIDYLYIDDESLSQAVISGRLLQIGSQSYRVVIVDVTDGEVDLNPASQAHLAAFTASGGTVIRYAPDAGADLIARLRRVLPPDVTLTPPHPGLRVIHVRMAGAAGTDVYCLFNEGETTITGTIEVTTGRSLPIAAEWWDPLRDTRQPAVASSVTGAGAGSTPTGPRPGTTGTTDTRFSCHLTLDRRESRLLVLGPAAGRAPLPQPFGGVPEAPGAGEPALVPVPGPWSVTYEDDSPAPAPALGDWSKVPALERFSGTLVYRTDVVLPLPAGTAEAVEAGKVAETVEVDLGTVAEAAAVLVNGQPTGSALWAPYRLRTPATLWHSGPNRLEVRVTNSAANYYEGALLPSGLIGPVTLRLRPRPSD